MGDEITADETNSVDETTAEETTEDSDAVSEEAKEVTDDASSSKEESPEEEDDEPPVRKQRTNAEWVKLRQERKARRDAERAQQGEEETEQDDDDISPEDAKIIDRRVAKHLEPIMKERQMLELKSEINDFVTENPDFKPFADKAAKWAQNPVWANVPTKQLMYAVAGDNLLKIGAQRRQAADERARRTRVAGGNAGGSASGKSVTEMSDAEFQAEVNAVLTKPRE